MTMHDAHFEIVHRNPTEDELADPAHAPQPFLARVRAANVQLTWGTETYVSRDGARGGIGQLASMFSPVRKSSVYADHVDVWLDDDEFGVKHSVPIVEIDLRVEGELHRFDAGRAVGGAIPKVTG